MDTASVKQEVWALADELNTALGALIIQPHQQDISLKNMSLTGIEHERLYIKPARHGYAIALSGNSLVARMEPFMEKLTGLKYHGYVHPHIPREPYWYLSDYEKVREAAYFYAHAIFPFGDDDAINEDIEEIVGRPNLDSTQKKTLIQARRGQGIYRKQVLGLWGGTCAVTGLAIQSAIIASHAKPWIDSTDEERLDPCNGLPLAATLDKLFDKYLIAFAPLTGEMLLSHRIDAANRVILGIPSKLRKTPTELQAYYL